jgi:hypothetical protein
LSLSARDFTNRGWEEGDSLHNNHQYPQSPTGVSGEVFRKKQPRSLDSNHAWPSAEDSYMLALMYNSHKLPPPSSFAQEHRPLRLTTHPTLPLPTGPCRFILLNPSVENQQCSCQSFHHNRGTPGSVCDCGHQACFHVHQPSAPAEGPSTNNQNQYSSSTALLNRIQRLEDALQQERAARETAIADERRAREREVRILREALHPFYKSEEEMKRKLIEVEDHLEGTYDEQLRLKDRIVALDDANMALERRVEETEGARSRTGYLMALVLTTIHTTVRCRAHWGNRCRCQRPLEQYHRRARDCMSPSMTSQDPAAF